MVDQTKQRTRGIPWWVSLLLYVLLAVLMTWPLASNLNSHFGSTDADMFNVYWGNWWVPRALASGQSPYFTDYLIYPVGFDLTTFAFSPLLALVSIPLGWIASPITAYNLLTWLTIVLCCLAMDHLVRYLTGDAWAALAAAVAFAFAPRLVAERASHLNMAFVVWLPWSALLLTKLVREARIRHAVLLAVVIALSFFTRPQVGALTVLFSGVFFLGLILVERRQSHRLAFRRLLLAGVLAILLLSPLLYLVQQALEQPGAESLLREGAELNQTDLLAYVLPPPQHPIFGSWTEPIYSKKFLINDRYWAFVGFVPLALMIYGLISRRRQAVPWLVTAVVFFLLALGPHLRFNGQEFPAIKLPYALAPQAFSLIGFDSPERFNLAVMAAVAVLVGLTAAWLAARSGKAWLPAIVALLILGEYLVAPIPVTGAPQHSAFYDQMAADGEEYAVVDLPLTREAGEIQRFYQTLHRKPMVGGWDRRVPASAFEFIDSNPLLATWRGRNLPEITLDRALGALADANVRFFVVHKDQIGSVPERMRGLLLALKPVYEDNTIYVLPVEATRPEAYQVVRRFDDQGSLLQPTWSLEAPAEGGDPQLTLEVCWWLGAERREAGQYALSLATADDVLLFQEAVWLKAEAEGLSCQRWPLGRLPSLQAEECILTVAEQSDERPPETYSAEFPLQTLESRDGTIYPAMGSPFGVSYEAPLELVGDHLTGNEGYLWVDLYWHSLEQHFQSYWFTLYLLDHKTGQIMASDQELLPKLEWGQGDLLHERRVIWLNSMPQGLYTVGIALSRMPGTGEPIAAFQEPEGDPWPLSIALLHTPALLLPANLRELPVADEGRVVAYSLGTEVAVDPEQLTNARFGEIAQLTGYRLLPPELQVGGGVEVTLYWRATNKAPVAVDYTVFVHVLDASGQLIAQHDGEPAAGRRSTRTWKNGDLVVDTHQLQWTTESYSGPATIVVGLYDLQTLDRLPAWGPDGERMADDRVALGQVQVR